MKPRHSCYLSTYNGWLTDFINLMNFGCFCHSTYSSSIAYLHNPGSWFPIATPAKYLPDQVCLAEYIPAMVPHSS